MLNLKTIRSEIIMRIMPEDRNDATGLVIIIKVYQLYSSSQKLLKKQLEI